MQSQNEEGGTPQNGDRATIYGRRADDRWHVGKEIPLALIMALFFQTAGGVWWASNLTTKIDIAITTLDEFRRERYTKDDGRRDREFMGLLVEGARAKDAELERRLAPLERAHEDTARVVRGLK